MSDYANNKLIGAFDSNSYASFPSDQLLEYQRKEFRQALDLPEVGRSWPRLRIFLLVGFILVTFLVVAMIVGGLFIMQFIPQSQQTPTISVLIAFSTHSLPTPQAPTATKIPTQSNTPTPTAKKETITPTMSDSSIVEGCVASQGLRIRETPSLDALTIGFLVEGDCRILDGRTEDNKWLRIQYDETLYNEVGWTSSKYIEIVKGEMESLSIIKFDQLSTETP